MPAERMRKRAESAGMVLGSVGRLGKVPTFVRKMTVNGIKIAKMSKMLPLGKKSTAGNCAGWEHAE